MCGSQVKRTHYSVTTSVVLVNVRLRVDALDIPRSVRREGATRDEYALLGTLPVEGTYKFLGLRVSEWVKTL